MRAVQHTPSHQLVRSTPSNVVRSAMMPLPSHLVTSNNPSQQVMRGNMVPSQDMRRRISSHHLAKSVPRPASSSQLPRNVSVKNNRDGTKEVVVETSVSVSYTFQQEDSDGQEGGEHGHKGQDDHAHHQLPLEDGTAPGHQLVCCSCMVSMPSMQVGDCGCLVCRLCMQIMDRPGYCKNCNITVRFTELERIIRFPEKGKLGRLFMAPREREDFSTKEFLKRVLKEEKEFKIVDRILNKQEAAFARCNTLHTEEVEKIVKEEEELQRKIVAKSRAISELEESIRLRSEQKNQHVSRPMLRYQPNQLIHPEANQQMFTKDDILHGAKPDDVEKRLNYDENDNTEYQQTMHDGAFMKDCMQEMGKEFQESIVYKARPEQIKHQVKQLLDGERKGKGSTKEATHSNWNPPSKVNICPVGSSVVGIVASPAVGLKSILKKKIVSRLFAEEATSPLCGEVKKKEEIKEKSRDGDEKIRQDKAGSLVVKDIICSSFRELRQMDKKGGRMEETRGRSNTQVPGHWREVDTPSKKRGRMEEAQDRNITQVSRDWREVDTPSKKRGRLEEAQDRNITQVPGDWREVDTLSKKEEMGEAQIQDSGRVLERKLDDNLKKREVDRVGRVIERGVECQVLNDRLEKVENISMKTLNRSSRRNILNDLKPGPVSAYQWMTRAVRGGAGMAGMAGTSSTRDRPSQAVGRERKALPPLSSVRNPDRRNVAAVEAGTAKTSSSSERKDKHNMTYDYLDMIVNRGVPPVVME